MPTSTIVILFKVHNLLMKTLHRLLGCRSNIWSHHFIYGPTYCLQWVRLVTQALIGLFDSNCWSEGGNGHGNYQNMSVNL